jgi:hypothetical protein
MRSARLLLVRRSRRASTRKSCSAISGRSAIHARKASRSIDTARTSVIVVALEVRGPGSKIDNSPNMSDGPMMVSRFSRPSGERRPIFTLPEMMMYNRSPGSPSAKTVCPRGKSTGCSCFVSAATAVGSTPWKIPALARISSTMPLQLSNDVIRAG